MARNRKRTSAFKRSVSDLSGGISSTGIKLDVPIDKGVAHPTLSPAKVFKDLSKRRIV